MRLFWEEVHSGKDLGNSLVWLHTELFSELWMSDGRMSDDRMELDEDVTETSTARQSSRQGREHTDDQRR